MPRRRFTDSLFTSVLLIGVLYLREVSSAHAAVDDSSFDACEETYAADPDILKGPIWHTSPLHGELLRMEVAQLWGDRILRWTAVKNPNGSRTIVIMTRGTGDVADEADGFDIFIQNGGRILGKNGVDTNGFAFSRHSSGGMFGLSFWKWGNELREWVWSGSDWYVPGDNQ